MVAQQSQGTNQPIGVFVQTAAASVNRDTFYAKDANGVLSKVEIEPDSYGMAPRQGVYRLRWKGVSDIFDMDGEFGKSKCVNCLFVINAPGTSEHKKMFRDMAAVMKWGEKSQSFYWNLGSQSKMGRMIEAITGQPLQTSAGINLTDYLGGEFEAFVKSTTGPDKNGVVRTKCSVAHDTIEPVETAGPAGPNQYAPAPEPVPATSNPFLGDDDL